MFFMPRLTTGPERPMLEHMLDRNRQAVIDCARGLSEVDARRRLVASLTTPIGLVKHAATAERIWFQRVLGGLGEFECDGYATGDDGSFVVADDETLEDVIAEFQRASERFPRDRRRAGTRRRQVGAPRGRCHPAVRLPAADRGLRPARRARRHPAGADHRRALEFVVGLAGAALTRPLTRGSPVQLVNAHPPQGRR